ncbi:hypothetical protein OUZ56_021255 [Daphnia magna]|uniref:Uncharacterized protein n=1 Tax=Daphnia magna TaxID=35525 RepID=A0ABQ9ZGU9_9CRUS|nr:hypothetical protein OUZ56_021255 [Daphnia magna]
MNRSPPRGVSQCFGVPTWQMMSCTIVLSSVMSICRKFALPSVTLRITGDLSVLSADGADVSGV